MTYIKRRDASVDVALSNFVINLSADRLTLLREATQVLRPGGLSVWDVIAAPDMDGRPARRTSSLARCLSCLNPTDSMSRQRGYWPDHAAGALSAVPSRERRT